VVNYGDFRKAAFKAEYIKLADAEMPSVISPEIEITLEDLIIVSYLNSFNVLMYIAAGLCVLCALVSWFLERDEKNSKSKPGVIM
jgi:hypothetical protein